MSAPANRLQAARDVKRAAELMERAYAAREIPTGELYRGIALADWQRAREAFFAAVDQLGALADHWQEEAGRFERNARYWRGRAEACEQSTEKTTWIEKNAHSARVLLLLSIAVWALVVWLLWP